MLLEQPAQLWLARPSKDTVRSDYSTMIMVTCPVVLRVQLDNPQSVNRNIHDAIVNPDCKAKLSQKFGINNKTVIINKQ